ESSTPFTVTFDFVAADDPFEPNDNIGAATPLPTSLAIAPTIYPRGDNDWYKVWIAQPGLLTAAASAVDEAMDVYIQVVDLNGKSVRGWTGPDRKGGDTLLEAELPEPGTYLIQVGDGNNDAASVKPFELSFRFDPVADENEPNNSFGGAVIVPPSGARQAAIFPRGDEDWLAVDVDHPGELVVLATNSPDNLDIYMQVLNADKTPILGWIGPARAGGDVEGVADLPTPGRYFIQIADGNNDQSSPDLFEVALAYTAEPDQYEPNNGPAEAPPLTLGGQILFNILPRGDNDWFRVEAASAGELAIVIDESPEDLDIYFQVVDADQKPITGWVAPYRKGGVTEGIADLPMPGIYFIQVSDGNNDARSVTHATLTTAFTPIAEAFEPNNSFGSAVPIELGESYRATILPRGDVDWYLLEAPRAGSFVITVDEVDEDLDIYVNLTDAEANAGGWFGPPRKGGVTEAELAVPAAGLYRLQIADGNNDARSAVPFRLRVDFK
ncbi:MAG: PPC domain-containing protein, partial [Bauldia sp.]